MILSDEQFRKVEERIIERESIWEDVEDLLAALKFFMNESSLQSDALREMLDSANLTEFEGKKTYVYQAMGSGAGVIRVKKVRTDEQG